MSTPTLEVAHGGVPSGKEDIYSQDPVLSARKLVMHAVQSQKISREELAEIRKMLDQLEEGKQ